MLPFTGALTTSALKQHQGGLTGQVVWVSTQHLHFTLGPYPHLKNEGLTSLPQHCPVSVLADMD